MVGVIHMMEAVSLHLTGKMSCYVPRDMALMGIYAYFNSMNRTLVMTSALRKSIRRRLGGTAKGYFDVTEVGGMDRFGAGSPTARIQRMCESSVSVIKVGT